MRSGIAGSSARSPPARRPVVPVAAELINEAELDEEQCGVGDRRGRLISGCDEHGEVANQVSFGYRPVADNIAVLLDGDQLLDQALPRACPALDKLPKPEGALLGVRRDRIDRCRGGRPQDSPVE